MRRILPLFLAGCRSLLGFEEPIVGDAAPLPTLGFEQGETLADETAGLLSIAVALSAPSATPVTARYEITGGSASLGLDAAFPSDDRTIELAPGETHAELQVAILPDGIREPVEELQLALASVDGALLDATRVHQITISDPLPVLRWKPTRLSVVEVAMNITFELQLDRINDLPVGCSIAVSGTAGVNDFSVITPSPLTIPAGALSTDVVVQVKQDPLVEVDETVKLELVDATNAIIPVDDEATLTIIDDD